MPYRKPTTRSTAKAGAKAKPTKMRKGEKAAVVLLSGGNPQIAKADGDASVQAYIAAMPGWKRDVGRRLDALIERTVPGVRKAVKWNSPFYGIEGPGEENGWFLSFHCFTKYIIQGAMRSLINHHRKYGTAGWALHQSGLLPRRVAAPCPARRVQA